MSRWQKTILAILGLMACCLLALIGWIAYQNYLLYWDAPLGPALDLPTLPASAPTFVPASVSTSAASPDGIVWLPTVTRAPNTPLPAYPDSPTSAPFTSCGRTDVMTLLAVGTDARSESYNYGLADVIRVVRVDFLARHVSILEFPRDLWVEIPEIADNLKGQDHEKLNQAYLYGNPKYSYWGDPSGGPGLLGRTLQLNFGVHADHYIAVNMRTFEEIVNAVGGIDLYLPEEVDARTPGDMRETLYFPAGTQHLDGAAALQLARLRNDGVFERADTQNRVLCALRDKLVTPSGLTQIPEIIASFTNNVLTDLTPEQIGQLACLGTRVSPEWILFASFPQEIFKNARVYDPVFKKSVFIWDADFNILRGYVTQFQAGAWPTPGAVEETGESTPFCPPPGQ
jgi:LCP family protein required for cell wall assembly